MLADMANIITTMSGRLPRQARMENRLVLEPFQGQAPVTPVPAAILPVMLPWRSKSR